MSRPVIAFAVLSQASDVFHTDVLSGISLLVQPLVSDLAGQTYDANELATRMGAAYGISVPGAALESFLPRLINAGILIREEVQEGVGKAVYRHQSIDVHEVTDFESEFQAILDEFQAHAEPLLKNASIEIPKDTLTNSFLRHLATLDFSAIKARPAVVAETGRTIVGAARREQIQLSEQLATDAVIDSLVASYIAKLQTFNQPRFALLTKVADGALVVELVLDLQAPMSVPRLTATTVVIDTPTILSYLDLSSEMDYVDAESLISQIKAAGPKIAAFRHSIEEAEGVLTAIQLARHTGEAYGPSTSRLQRQSYSRYFESMKSRIGLKWLASEFEIIQEAAGQFYGNFSQEAEEQLTNDLRLTLYDRRLTRERDAKSVAETVRRLAGGHIPKTDIASCRFMFLTSNSSLQRKSSDFLRRKGYVSRDEFVPVVTTRYFSGLCWMIAGGKSDQSPTMARLLANCANALQLKPELANRAKRFLSEIDEEKAKHFEALMTDQRASQYLAEITFGDANLITALNVEEIYEEAQRRSAEKVAVEKDAFYQLQLGSKDEQIAAENIKQAELQERLTLETMEREATAIKLETETMNRQAAEADRIRLQKETEQKTAELLEKEETLNQLSRAVTLLEEADRKTQLQLKSQREAAVSSAQHFAAKRIRLIRFFGAAALFLFSVGLGYLDKFIIPNLAPVLQSYGNWGIIGAQAALALSGLAILFDPIVGKRLESLRIYIYQSRLTALGMATSPSSSNLEH